MRIANKKWNEHKKKFKQKTGEKTVNQKKS